MPRVGLRTTVRVDVARSATFFVPADVFIVGIRILARSRRFPRVGVCLEVLDGLNEVGLFLLRQETVILPHSQLSPRFGNVCEGSENNGCDENEKYRGHTRHRHLQTLDLALARRL